MAIDTAQQASPIEDVSPVSALQENMIACNRSTARPGQDIEQVVGDLREELDVEAFAEAWQRIVRRHSALRSAFSWSDGQPCQHVHRELTIPLVFEDWRERSEASRESEFREWLKADRRRGFDLREAPLVRACLFEFGESHFRFVWTFHHVLMDATAFAMVLEELFGCYEAIRQGVEPAWASTATYGQPAETLPEGQSSDVEAFWKELLEGFEPCNSLGVSAPSKEVSLQDEPYGEITLSLGRSDLAQLRSVAEREAVALSTLLYGAWAFLLGRYAGVEDVVFGTVHACRRGFGEKAARAIGLLINTVPVRIKLPAGLTVSEWLRMIRTQQNRIRPLVRTPLLQILEWACGASKVPLFETVVNFQDPAWHDRLRQLGNGWAKREFRVYNQPGYPLWLDAWAGEGLSLRIGYDRSRFDDAAMARMLEHLGQVLKSITRAEPEMRVEDLELMSESERHQVLHAWSAAQTEPVRPGMIQDWVTQVAHRTPGALAVASSVASLSYEQLIQAANQIAHFLKQLGAGPEKKVAVCMPRAVELVAAELGILKAGAAFVPLDPCYPKERLNYMIADSNAIAVLISDGQDAGELDASRPLIPVNLARPGKWGEFPSTEPPQECTPENLAYVIYTSGTSGRPKGVAVEHRGLANLVTWHVNSYSVTAPDRATLLASPAFDASVWEVWPYLSAGASLWIPDEQIRLSPDRLIEWLSNHGITLTFLATPLVERLLDEPWPAGMPLRAVLTGGERLRRNPPAGFQPRLINHYGPTECSVVATAGAIDPGQQQPPSIGRPISNIRAYCLDSHLRPMPVGVAGELCLSGAGMARGYLNQPGLTEEKFVANPFAEAGHERLYRTGDRVRWRADGTLEFVGRIDRQLKIRGQRVEPGEIEAVLAEHPSVRSAVIKATAGTGTVSLQAYVVRHEGAESTSQQLKAWLGRRLPRHMVPESVQFIDVFPLTPSGKVDYSALRLSEDEPRSPGEPPRTPMEEIVAGVWSEVLDLPAIGRNENFFELGGHSLQAMQVTARLRNRFHVELPIHDLFEAPTISALAEKIAGSPTPLPSPRAEAARPGDGELVASFAQERLWFLEQLEPGVPLHNVPFAIQLRGHLNISALERSLGEIVRRHQPLRTVFVSRDGQPVLREQVIDHLELPMTDLSDLEAAQKKTEARRLSLEHARVPFDLSAGPLLKARLVRLGPEEHLLLLTTHLIASDGWSVGVLYKELAALYAAFSCGHESPLSPPAMTYSDFARWQRQSLTGPRLQTALAYWRQQLGSGSEETVSLPTDFPRPQVQSFRGATQFFALPAGLARSLKKISRQEDVTFFMLLLAGFKTLLSHYSGERRVSVGSPTAGRSTVSNTEELIGAFVNTLVLRTDLGGDPTFRELLGRVRATCLGAYWHQELPLEKVVDALQPRRDPSRHPLFQVMFTFQNAPMRPLELVGLELEPVPLDAGISKFDLTLLLEETEKGLAGSAEYNIDLFAESTITQILANFQTLLDRISANPGSRLSALTAGLGPLSNSRAQAHRPKRNPVLSQRKEVTMHIENVSLSPGRARRKAVRMDVEELVSIQPLFPDRPAPILIEPRVAGVSLPEWARSHKERVEQLLMEHRALLFRNFGIASVDRFQECVLATCNGELLNYVDRSTPRPSVGDKVYVSTIYPSAETIHMHNEGTYWQTWPLKIYFCSLVTAEQGGETPIADVRKVLARLSPELREQFLRKQISYVRNYNDGFGLPWQETFQTRDKAEVEAYCRANNIQFEWKEGDRLRTRQVRPAIRIHPRTREQVWFNHGAFFHISSLAPQVREELLAAFAEEDLPYNTYYGDGTPIEPEAVAAIRDAYAQEKIIFPWQNGDVLLLDNMSMAHGRQPYTGRREVVVSMAEPYRES